MSVVARSAAGRARGVAVLAPPWKIPALSLVSGWQRLLARAGFDVWTLVPPRHLERSPPGERSGERFVSPDLRVLEAALVQLVLELRLLAALARERGGETAMIGLSLGALGVAFAAAGPERIDHAALVAPPADLGRVFDGTRIGRRYAALAARAGTPVPGAEALAPILAVFDPGARPPTARRVFLAAGSEDRIATCAAALDLARAWRVEPRLYPRGHLTLLFACRAVRRDLARFLAGDAPERRARLPL